MELLNRRFAGGNRVSRGIAKSKDCGADGTGVDGEAGGEDMLMLM
jgi:hypothetical protein